MDRRYYIEYTGPWPNQNWYYDGKATPFWTLSDGRQVSNARTEKAFRYIVSKPNRIEPFVPQSDSDWDEIQQAVINMELDEQIVSLRESIGSLSSQITSIREKAEAKTRKADSLELHAQNLRTRATEMVTSIPDLETEMGILANGLDLLMAQYDPVPEKPLTPEEVADGPIDEPGPLPPKPRPKAKKKTKKKSGEKTS